MSTAIRSSPASVSWSSEFNWNSRDFNTAKSFPNVESHAARGISLHSLPTVAAAWNWNYRTRSETLKSVVAFDIWIGAGSARAGSSHQVQIWLSEVGGARPTGSQAGIAPCIAGYDWEVWRGRNGSTEVITFTNLENADITNFTGDMGEFFDYLVLEAGVPESNYIQSIQAGNTVFNGRGNFQTSLYTLWVEYPQR
ncbi:hypothetical protein CC2G_013790 [Coprinopsis cinerea AmutBmut pab1-1]|nr:hypothetical protein CC2G_013790 [Coprinopsis cinerea AmutBmut pab1-1]